MFDYYFAIIVLVWVSLLVLSVLVFENERIGKEDKWLFYMSYLLIALSALAELGGVKLNGHPDAPRWALITVKTFDYILTPLAGGAIIAQMKMHNAIEKALIGLLTANVVYQIISAFTGWMISVDANNVYTHANGYWVYIGMYLAVIALVLVQFILYGTRFRRQNRFSLYAIIAAVIVGIVLQEALGYRTAYVSLAFGATMMFIHYVEFSQLRSDDRIKEQTKQILTDPLTGTGSRYGYYAALKFYTPMPENLVAFMLDINGLKTVNDELGHDAGDELIIGAADSIRHALGKDGKVFRIGGDEFVAFITLPKECIESAVDSIKESAGGWRGEKATSLSLSVGYASSSDHPDSTVEQLVKDADTAMYQEKAAYYQKRGIDRRKA